MTNTNNNGYRFEVVRNYSNLEGPFRIRAVGTNCSGHHYRSARDVASFVITGISHGFIPEKTTTQDQKNAERVLIRYDEVRVDREVHSMPEFKDGKTVTRMDKKTKKSFDVFVPGYYEAVGGFLVHHFGYKERPLEEFEAHQKESKGLEAKVALPR